MEQRLIDSKDTKDVERALADKEKERRAAEASQRSRGHEHEDTHQWQDSERTLRYQPEARTVRDMDARASATTPSTSREWERDGGVKHPRGARVKRKGSMIDYVLVTKGHEAIIKAVKADVVVPWRPHRGLRI